MKRTRIEDPRWLQVKVERSLWKTLKSVCLNSEMSMAELVRETLNRAYGESAASSLESVSGNTGKVVGMESNPTSTFMSGSTGMNSEVTSKSERDRQMEENPLSTTSVPVNSSTLKEDHGWCKGCGVNQVRLPAMLCKECRKEAGEDL